jgi:anti-sigma regulatory factor (Ser/Thr protein kinase)
MSPTHVHDTPTCAGFRHEALLYAGRHDFLRGTVPFLREGLEQDESILVVVDHAKIAELREALGDDAQRVQFADMAQVGRNPARIIPRWRQFVSEHLACGRPVRGIGEPIWAGRSAAELIECQAHETLLNLAFADGAAWDLLCPYDVEALDPVVVEEARRSHPFVARDGCREVSGDYLATHPSPARLDHPLPPAPQHAETVTFGPQITDLRTVRAVVARHAEQAGVPADATENLLIAATELATNSLRHGGSRGILQLWVDNTTLVCEVRDTGRLNGNPLLGRQPPTVDQWGGRGLWLVNQLCDLTQVRSTTTGTVVRVHTACNPIQR